MSRFREAAGDAAAGDQSPAQAERSPGRRTRVAAAAPGQPSTRPAGSGGISLPEGLRASLEQGTASDLSRVRLHTGAASAAQAADLGARAFAVGQDIHFGAGEYAPETPAGQHLLAHEVAHTVQSPAAGTALASPLGGVDSSRSDEAAAEGFAVWFGRSAAPDRGPAPALSWSAGGGVRCFDAREHMDLGAAATGSAVLNVGGANAFQLGYGDLVAIPDFMERADFFRLAAIPGDFGRRAGTRDEIVAALYSSQGRSDARFRPGGAWAQFAHNFDHDPAAQAVRATAARRGEQLAARDGSHFASPHRGMLCGTERSARNNYHDMHEAAVVQAYQDGAAHTSGPSDQARAYEGFAQHYLTDQFSAGHMRTPLSSLVDYWDSRYPLFWDSFLRKIAHDTARELQRVHYVGQLFVDIERRVLTSIRSRASSVPAATVGRFLNTVFHDYDNTHGVQSTTQGRMYGDGHLDRNTTDHAVAAMRAGLDDLGIAHRLGATAPGLVDPATGNAARLAAAVQSATRATAPFYRAEQMVPRVEPGQPQPNYTASSLEALMAMPMVGAAGAPGVSTVGDEIVAALQPSRTQGRVLERVEREFASESAEAGAAYRAGFLEPFRRDIRRGVLEVANWTGGDSAPEAGGYLAELGAQASGLTLVARTRTMRLILDEPRRSRAHQLPDLFRTASPADRLALYRAAGGTPTFTGRIEGELASLDIAIINQLTPLLYETIQDGRSPRPSPAPGPVCTPEPNPPPLPVPPPPRPVPVTPAPPAGTSIYFANERDEQPSAGEQATARRWAGALAPDVVAALADGRLRLTCHGHASVPGAEPFNQTLGQTRAENIRDLLAPAIHLAPARIITLSTGESEAQRNPQDPNARHRRVDITITVP